jgi:hypothetical protein
MEKKKKNEKLRTLCTSPNRLIIRVMKSRRMRMEGDVAQNCVQKT